jgi:hypothetical protein
MGWALLKDNRGEQKKLAEKGTKSNKIPSEGLVTP